MSLNLCTFIITFHRMDLSLVWFIFFFLDRKIVKIIKNSWGKHFSLIYNERYNYILKETAAGYSLFATLSLALYLMKASINAKYFESWIIELIFFKNSQLSMLYLIRESLKKNYILLSQFWFWREFLNFWKWQWHKLIGMHHSIQ